MESFINILKLSKFSTSEIDHILQTGVVTRLKKGQIFSKQGEMWNKIGVLQQGILGGWKLNENGEKQFIQFYVPSDNYFVVDYECFVLNIAAEQMIEALDDCLVLEFNRKICDELREHYPNLLELEKIVAQTQYLKAQKVLNLVRNCTAVEMLKIIRTEAPEILAKVPYSYVASFLGMHRNTLSEAMKKL